jgi:hypothetical protein
MTPLPAIADRGVGRLMLLLLSVLGLWLAAAALLVNVEYGDGYSTVANADYLLGTSESWFWQRGPLMALLLLPGEWLAQRLALAPLDVRPHHAVMAVLHLLYLVGVWRLLSARYGSNPATLLGWLAAIPTMVFFSYAPFISHDILPGLLVLWLLRISARYPERSSALDPGLFFALVATLVLIKQSYAVVPAAVLLSRLGALLSTRGLTARELHAGLLLAGTTVIAGALCWLVYAAFSAARFPEIPFLLRPLAIIGTIANVYEGPGEPSDAGYPWVYLRNVSAYGILAMTLVLPGLVLAWRAGDSASRQLALCWLMLLAALLWTPFKEVRYLGFLAPLTASLIIPVIALALDRGWPYRALLGLVLLADLARVAPEAARITDPYYQEGVTAFFEPLASAQHSDVPVFFGKGWLSFIAPDPRAFVGDSFHRIVEMQIEQVRTLYHLPRERVFRVSLAAVADAAQVQDGALFLIQNQLLSRGPPYASSSRSGLPADFAQFLARTADVEFVLDQDRYVARDLPGTPIMLLRQGAGSTEMARVQDAVDVATMRHYGGFNDTPEQVSLRVLVILRECDLSGCRRTSD